MTNGAIALSRPDPQARVALQAVRLLPRATLAEGKMVDHRTDLFSLGIILYELATGERPFKGDSNASVLSSILRDTPPPVSDLNAGIPRPIARLIRRCLEKTPSERLQSALDLKHELEDLRADATSNVSAGAVADVRPQGSVSPRQRLSIKALALVVLALALSAGAYVTWTRWRPLSATSENAGSTASVPITVKRFENRTGDSTLDPIGQMVADALSQELPHLGDVMQGVGTGRVPRSGSTTLATQQPGEVTGAYYLDGQNLRIQASLTSEPGAVIYAIEPAAGPRTDPGKAVDLVRQRMLGAIVAWLDPNLGGGRMSRPPLYSAYREYKAGLGVFTDDPAKAITHHARAIELDPDFFDPWYQTVLANRNMADYKSAREAIDRMSAKRDRWNPKEQALLAFLGHANDGRLLDALTALREAEKLDPADLSTNYLIGVYDVRLNRPQEAIDQYSKINADAWDSVTIGTWRYARLATANHLLGRHDEELKVAIIARETFPTSFLSRNDELIALAALGRMDDLRRAVDNTLTMAVTGGDNPARLMRFAAEELRAHGHRAESIDLARRSVAWYRNRPADFLTSAANRFSLALSLYDAEEWAEAGSITAALIKEQPGNSAYLGLAGAIAARMGDSVSAMKQAAALSRLASERDGIVELTRAQLEALLGQRERAVELLRDAFARGLTMSTALHRQMDFESLRGFVPFDELMRPKG